jgi:hypothetical protein
VYINLSSGEINRKNLNLIDGTPIKISAVEGSMLPSNINEALYFVYRTSESTFRLYDDWRKIALMEGRLKPLNPLSGEVNMIGRFKGASILQSSDNIDVEASSFSLPPSSYSDVINGTPIMLSSDKPVVSEEELSNENSLFDVLFRIYYPGGGMSERVVRDDVEDGLEVPKNSSKTAKDTYVVYDPRYKIPSMAACYWDQNDGEEDSYAYASRFCDAHIPGGFDLRNIEANEHTVDFGEVSSFKLFVDDYLSPNLKGQDFHITSMAFRLDVSASVEGHSQIRTLIYGVPGHFTQEEATGVFSKISIAWDREGRFLTFGKKGSEDFKLTFQIGVTCIDQRDVTHDTEAFTVGLLLWRREGCSQMLVDLAGWGGMDQKLTVFGSRSSSRALP